MRRRALSLLSLLLAFSALILTCAPTLAHAGHNHSGSAGSTPGIAGWIALAGIVTVSALVFFRPRRELESRTEPDTQEPLVHKATDRRS